MDQGQGLSAFVFAVAVFSTVFVTAVNAYTWTIGYPLWRFVGKDEFARVHAEYLRRLRSVITMPHVLMFFADAALVWVRPVVLSPGAACVLCGLAWATVGVSAFVAGPIHSRFARAGMWEEAGMRALILVSTARTVMMLAASTVLMMAIVGACFAIVR